MQIVDDPFLEQLKTSWLMWAVRIQNNRVKNAAEKLVCYAHEWNYVDLIL